MANPNGRPAMNGTANRNIRIASNGAAGGAKVDPNDPQVRKLVYNMYRGMLGQQHKQANQIVDSAPQEKVEIDAGVGARVESMMRQQSQLKGGGMNTAGNTLPPPPPPPIPTVLPSSRLPTEIPARAPPVMNPPAALAGAMMKEKKPFTYTPGGIDLSEINSPNQNGSDHGESMAPVQSRSFRVLQNVLSNQDVAEPQGPVHIPNLRQQQKPSPVQQPVQYQPPSHYQPTTLYQQPGGMTSSAPTEDAPPEPKKYMGGSIPSRSFKMLQALTSTDDVAGPGQSDL